MGLMDELRKLTQPYEDEDDYFDEADKPVQGFSVKPRPAAAVSAEVEFEKSFGSAAPVSQPPVENEAEDDEDDMSGGLFGNLGKRVKKQQASSPVRERTMNFGGKESQVILFNPKTFDEAGELVVHLGRKRSLVMTLEGLPTETARRLLDFISGIAFAMKGKITPVSAKTYFISPENVDLLGSDSGSN